MRVELRISHTCRGRWYVSTSQGWISVDGVVVSGIVSTYDRVLCDGVKLFRYNIVNWQYEDTVKQLFFIIEFPVDYQNEDNRTKGICHLPQPMVCIF